ncbi:MAG: hypothetical protein M1832_002600 [Thelocarpon impressellum]|nr:MAG: hypothetical protein M1832_002600 [Thelocarpon impressellum]
MRQLHLKPGEPRAQTMMLPSTIFCGPISLACSILLLGHASLAAAAPPAARAGAEPALSLNAPASVPQEPKQTASCTSTHRVLYSANRIIRRRAPEDRRGCGQGLLDNLRGQCGVITSWECWYGDDSGGRYEASTFITLGVASRSCVKDAIYLASEAAKVETHCSGSNLRGLGRR